MFKKLKIVFIITAAAIVSFGIAACNKSFLDQETVGLLTEAELQSSKGAQQLLTSAYAALKGINWEGGGSNWVYGSIVGGEANKGSDAGDQADINPIQQFSHLPTNRYFNDKWRALYEGVARSNATIRTVTSLTEDDITPELQGQILAEARFLRGYYHFEAKKMWNNIPFVDETINYGEGNFRVPNTTDAWPLIMADLEFARTNLTPTKGEVGRINKWGADAFYAKALLFQGNYAAAIPIFTDVIQNGVTAGGIRYGLAPRYQDVHNAEFENDETVRAESVFAYEASINDGSTGGNANFDNVLNFPYTSGIAPGGCCGFFQPSFEFVNSFRTDALGLPLLDGSYNTGANQVKTDQGLASADAFTPDAGNLDSRLDWTVGRRGIPYLDWGNHPGRDWMRDQANGGPHSPKKLVYYRSQTGTLSDGTSWTSGLTAINYKIMRFADVLLMAAEAEIEAGDLGVATGYINQVRARAASPGSWVPGAPATYVVGLYPVLTSQDNARLAVRLERKLELGMEGHRFFDLVRWGIAAETINAFLTYEKTFLSSAYGGATFIDPKHNYFPIPQTQIDLQQENGESTLQQNPQY